MIERIDISSLTKDLAKDLKTFERSCIPKAEAAALLRVSRSALSRWVKKVANRTSVKQKLIRGRASNRAIRSGGFVYGSEGVNTRLHRGRILTMNGAPMPASILGPKGKIPKQGKKGVRIAGRHYPGGFIASARFGKRHGGQSIFERDGEARGPIHEARIHIVGMVESSMSPAVREAVNLRYPKEFEHALERCLKARTRAR